jgi:hypothetical protein
MVSAVASGRFRYPCIRTSPPATISPIWPGGSGFASSSKTRTSSPSKGRPTLPVFDRSRVLAAMPPLVSVRP